jgi:hypothetical protein
MVKPLTYICNSDSLKPCRSISGEFDATEVAEVVLEEENALSHTSLKNSDRLFFVTHFTYKILLSQIYAYLGPSGMPSVGKGLGAMVGLLKK